MNKEQVLKEALAFILSQECMSQSARIIAFNTLKKVNGPEWLPECNNIQDVDKWMKEELERITALCIDDAKRAAK